MLKTRALSALVLVPVLALPNPQDAVIAQDRQGLLRDISEVFSREKLNVIGVSTQSQRGEARMGFTAEVKSAGDIARVGALLRDVSGVIAVRRR